MMSAIRPADARRHSNDRSRAGAARRVVLLLLALCIGIGAPSAIVVWTHGGHATPEQIAIHERELARGNRDHHPDAPSSPESHARAAAESASSGQALEHASGRTDADDPCVRDVALGIVVPDTAQVRTGDLGSVVPLDLLKLLHVAVRRMAPPEHSSRLGALPLSAFAQRFIAPLDPPPISS